MRVCVKKGLKIKKLEVHQKVSVVRHTWKERKGSTAEVDAGGT